MFRMANAVGLAVFSLNMWLMEGNRMKNLERAIVLVGGVIVSLCIVWAFAGCDIQAPPDVAGNTIPPEKSAAAFAAMLGLHVEGAPFCTGTDTDHDGYVSCTVNAGDGHLVSLQCAALGAGGHRGWEAPSSPWAAGCKTTDAKGAPAPQVNVTVPR